MDADENVEVSPLVFNHDDYPQCWSYFGSKLYHSQAIHFDFIAKPENGVNLGSYCDDSLDSRSAI